MHPPKRQFWTVYFLVFALGSSIGYWLVGRTHAQKLTRARLESEAEWNSQSRLLREEAKKLEQIHNQSVENLEREQAAQVKLLNKAYEDITQKLNITHKQELQSLSESNQYVLLKLQNSQNQKLLQLRGSDLDWVTKNPSNDIRSMLLHLAQQSAPSRSQIKVSVDRFSEFSIFLGLLPSQTNQIPSITRSILARGSPYVSQIEFASLADSSIFARIDIQNIHGVSDWNKTTDSELLSLLRTSNRMRDSYSGDGASVESTELEQDTDIESAVGLPRILANLDTLENRTRKTVNEALALHHKAAAIETLNGQESANDIDSRIQKQSVALQKLKVSLDEGTFDSFQSLLHEGYSREYATIVAREINKRMTLWHAVVQAALREGEALMDYLAVMQRFRGSWNTVPQTTLIRFDSASAQEAYEKALQQRAQASKQVDDALKDLRDLKSPR